MRCGELHRSLLLFSEAGDGADGDDGGAVVVGAVAGVSSGARPSSLMLPPQPQANAVHTGNKETRANPLLCRTHEEHG